jgi:Ca-activated chloride channel family protein
MTFLWPQNLWFLLAIPAVAAACALLRYRRSRAAHRYPGLMKKPAMQQAAWCRVPAALFVAALAAIVVATARPAAPVTVAAEGQTVILAIDVSGSMRATDVAPSRLAAAQSAARSFIQAQPSGVRIGIVAFSDVAWLVQPPTTSREQAAGAVEVLQPQEGTAIGSAILESLKVFPDERPKSGGKAAGAVVLLTDGQNSAGPAPAEAANAAAEQGVRVYTVGVGTSRGRIGDESGWSMRVGIDEQALKEIAAQTGGEYFYASSALELKEVYASLSSTLVLKRAPTEVTALFCAFAALAATVSVMLSLLWFGRIV